MQISNRRLVLPVWSRDGLVVGENENKQMIQIEAFYILLHIFMR